MSGILWSSKIDLCRKMNMKEFKWRQNIEYLEHNLSQKYWFDKQIINKHKSLFNPCMVIGSHLTSFVNLGGQM